MTKIKETEVPLLLDLDPNLPIKLESRQVIKKSREVILYQGWERVNQENMWRYPGKIQEKIIVFSEVQIGKLVKIIYKVQGETNLLLNNNKKIWG